MWGGDGAAAVAVTVLRNCGGDDGGAGWAWCVEEVQRRRGEKGKIFIVFHGQSTGMCEGGRKASPLANRGRRREVRGELKA